MAAYIVTYDLHQAGQNYSCLKKQLESYPRYWHMQRSVWVIETASSARHVRDQLADCLNANDDLFVGKLEGTASWRGFGEKAGAWLKGLLEAL